jgi:preprotein translocase subunit SecE
MAKERSIGGSIWQALFQAGLYKPAQGRVTRQVTFAALAVTFALAAWRLREAMQVSPTLGRLLKWVWSWFSAASQPMWLHDVVCYGVPALVLVGGVWFSYRIVNYPRFADFLVAVEAEMNKVSWPSRAELFRSSIVVIVVIFVLAAVLFGYDQLWNLLFRFLGILRY